ncbi:unnamed protein product [Rangifer tarandus platyrhynchus]|uniref:Uncharacterized protein n=2 Tax=Rangifer tarandus platyrhynchus TaxID=3082113 RepID=A0ABN9A0A3_RANTA|nr:unnamed protein product [Rangifer tarandus platyrhynchus]
MQETQVGFLDWEDPLKKEMTAPSSILAWGMPWTEEPGGLQSVGSEKSQARFNDYITTRGQLSLVISCESLHALGGQRVFPLTRGENKITSWPVRLGQDPTPLALRPLLVR